VIFGVVFFLGLLGLALLALPQRRVKRSRLGIEREPLNLSRSVDTFLEHRGRRQGVAQALVLAGVSTEPGTFVLRVFIGSLLVAIGMLALAGPVLALVGFVAPILVARMVVTAKGRKRRNRFAEQLPDTIQMMITSLRSGFGLSQTLEIVAEEAEEPTRTEIARVMSETRMGRDLTDAMQSLAERMDNQDLQWVVGAININRDTGGNLAEILENVGSTVRERARMKRKVRTFTAEGRMSARVLTALPFLMALLQWRVNPKGFESFFSGLGLVLLGACGVLLLLGWLWIRKIVSIKI
jgi:tight adherence protein B